MRPFLLGLGGAAIPFLGYLLWKLVAILREDHARVTQIWALELQRAAIMQQQAQAAQQQQQPPPPPA